MFFGLQITAGGDFSHEIKRCLLLGKISINKLDPRSLIRAGQGAGCLLEVVRSSGLCSRHCRGRAVVQMAGESPRRTAFLAGRASAQMAPVGKHLPARAGDARDFPSLGLEDPLEKGMATCSSIPAWKILWAEEPGRLQSMAGSLYSEFLHKI